MPDAAPIYTAAQLAAAAGVSTRAVLLRLQDAPPSGHVAVKSQKTKAWSLAALPPAFGAQLATLARQRGHATADALLADPPQPYAPPKPWHQIPAAFQQQAAQLAAALAPALARQHDLTGPALMELAQSGYRQHFGHTVKGDFLRYVMDRATRRDNGFNQWQRPDLYLDDSAFHQSADTAPAQSEITAPLDHYVAHIQNPQDITLSDRAYLFHDVFRHFETLVKDHPTKGGQRAIKQHVIEYLLRRLPALYRPKASEDPNTAKPLLALRRLFNLNYTLWTAGGRTIDTLRDNRAEKCGREGYSCPPCEANIRALAITLRGPRGKKGNVSLAITKLIAKNQLCAACLPRLHGRKLSAAFRLRVTPNEIEVATRKGSDAVRKIGPDKHCDWSGSQAGDYFVTDDMTTNELAWEEVDGETIYGQVQLLYTEDEFSSYPLPFLMYFGAPNSITIKNSLLLVFLNVGLPHEAVITERGVYANRMLAGEKRAKDTLAFRELETALRQYTGFAPATDEQLMQLRGRQLGLRDPAFGLRIQHATSPQAKTVERTFFEHQKSASLLPGFRGFNQRNEATRAMVDFDRRVKSGKEHPGNEYLPLATLRKNYEAICQDFANRSKGGRHKGSSPRELWQEALSRRPLRKLPEEMEHLLATHRLPDVKVTSKGICVTLNKYEKAWYYNGDTGPLVNQRVTVYINYAAPSFIHILDTRTGKLAKVPRSHIKRHNATPAELAQVNAARQAHISGARAQVGNVDNLLTAHIVRDNIYPAADMAAGRAIGEATRQHHAEQAEHQRAAKAVAALALERGDDPAQLTKPAAYKASVQREDELRAKYLSKHGKDAKPT